MKTLRDLFQRGLLATLLLFLPVSAMAQFIFVTNNGVITITGYTGTGGAVAIPETTNGWPVANIGSAAFSNKLAITSVAIPNSTTNLGTNAFYLCSGMTNVSLGTGLLAIAPGAFYGCKQLPGVIIPDTVRNLGSNVFNQCSGLTSVAIGNAVTNLGASVFQACSNLTSLAVPSSVTNLGDNACNSCTSLTNVTLGSRVRNIGASAFLGCVALTAIILPNSVTTIGSSAFRSCSNLASIIVPDSVTNLSFGVFTHCTGLQTAVIGNHVPALSSTFWGCTGLQSVSIGTNVISTSAGAFYACSGLTNVFLPAALTNLGAPEFRECASLLTIDVAPANPAYVSVDGVLFDKSQKMLVRFPGGKTGSYTIADSVNGFGYGAFWECNALTNLMIGSGLTNLSYDPFDPDTSLQTIAVSPSNPVYRSVNGVLFDKNQLTLLRFPPAHSANYAIPGGTTTLGPFAFVFSSLLTSITIPASVTNFQDSAFSFCSNLTAVTFLGDAPLSYNVDAYLFSGDTNATVYFLPGTTGWSSTLADRPTALWNPQMQSNDGYFGVRTNHFGFSITGTTNLLLVVEASTNLNTWTPLQTVTLTNGSAYFSDPQWANYPGRFYRLRSP